MFLKVLKIKYKILKGTKYSNKQKLPYTFSHKKLLVLRNGKLKISKKKLRAKIVK